jgi:hypothetical protein
MANHHVRQIRSPSNNRPLPKKVQSAVGRLAVIRTGDRRLHPKHSTAPQQLYMFTELLKGQPGDMYQEDARLSTPPGCQKHPAIY